MAEAEARILEGVEHNAAPWVVRQVVMIVDAWGRLDGEERARVMTDAAGAGEAAKTRVSGELRALFARDPADQRATPLEIVRTLRWEASGVLARAGVAEVERDAFEERAFPDDVYGIVPRGLGDLGDSDLHAVLMAWGVAKARILRDRKNPGQSLEQ